MTTATVPTISQQVPIHLTALSSTTLSNATLLEESNKVDIVEEGETVERKNLNSAGWTQTASTWKSASGSIDYKVLAGSTTQALIVAGGTAFLTFITNAGAGPSAEMGRRYEIVFKSVPKGYEAGAFVGGTATFTVNGAPTIIMGS